MIPSTNNKLLVTQDWKKIYQSFRNADFKSYDFETLRRTMISYLQENYPEDFNDFIDSSEYIALVDLIAYLGQNLSFRIDLNARENFLETAEKRDSILRLAQLISYVPKRNIPASGLLKITSILTTESIIDPFGNNLANSFITWNDPANTNWYQQFTSILSGAMGSSYVFGKPFARKTVDGILTEQYKINSTNSDLPIFEFLKNINGVNMQFEVVSASIQNSSTIVEDTPLPSNEFSLLYRNDNQGSGSENTGFFVLFKQGSMELSSFTLDNPVPNEIIGINAADINDTDVWLWQIDSNGDYSTLWEKVPAVTGNNIIYNSLNKNQRNIYSITTRDQDQIDLNFADGTFGNLPKGQFRLFYRQSNGLTYIIKPEQLSGITIEIPYLNKNGQSHKLSLILGLQYNVSNSSGTESNSSIQNKAPQAFYVQNRMVTAEDYNVAPLTLGNDILKVKSVNRISSGISKYFDLTDVSGKYGKTNIFASDGILYKELSEQSFNFEYITRNEVFAIIKDRVQPILSSPELRSFYIDQYPQLTLSSLTWVNAKNVITETSGYFVEDSLPVAVGVTNTGNKKYITEGSLIKFVPPSGKYFTSKGKLVSTQSDTTTNYIWVKVSQVIDDGSNSGAGLLDTGSGPIKLSTYVPSTAIPVTVIPKFVTTISYAFENEIVNLCMNRRNFGLSFDQDLGDWYIVLDTNINLVDPFSLSLQGNTDNLSKDASWTIAFIWNGIGYTVKSRTLNYIFESDKETGFIVDENSINFDFVSNTVVKDQIKVLSVNSSVEPIKAANTSTFGSLGKDYVWQIDSAVVEVDGYVNPKKIKVSFYDTGEGKIQDPDSFNNIVDPNNTDIKFVYFKKINDREEYSLVDSDLITAHSNPTSVSQSSETPLTGDLYYFYDSEFNVVKSYDQSLVNTGDPWVYQPDYIAKVGRNNLKFQYIHNSNDDRRIDPAKSNMIDVYLLTSEYDRTYRTWLTTGGEIEPLPPTSQSLDLNFSSSLESIKTISDEIVFQPVKYKVLFGSKAPSSLQATFKAVRNSTRTTSDNELKTRILNSIQEFFSLENWDFGQTFYFSELSTYVMNQLTPDITNFVIVPLANNFGSLFEITCLSNEIFINGAGIDDIEIIDAISASQLKTTFVGS
jgi:hypothetical protein